MVENDRGKLYVILLIYQIWLFFHLKKKYYLELRLFDKQEARVTKTHVSYQGRKDLIQFLKHPYVVILKPVLVLQTPQE